MESVLGGLSHFITTNIETAGYPVIFVLMLLESSFVPIPSEVTMPFAGFMASQGKLNLVLVIVVGGVANLAGSLVGYWIGYKGQSKVHIWAKLYGKYLLVSLDDVETAERWFRTRGEMIAFFSRLLPAVRTFISLPAGMARMNVVKFSLYSFSGAIIWSTILTYIGFVLGENWQAIDVYFRKFQIAIICLLLLPISFYVYGKLRKFKKI